MRRRNKTRSKEEEETTKQKFRGIK